MLMDIKDVLDLARTPEEREYMKQSIIKHILEDTREEKIDFSDIPEVTDFSGWRPAKPYLDKIREHNKRVQAEQERARLEAQGVN